MKAVITQIVGNTAVSLSDDGCISKIKNRDYTLGQEIEMKTNIKIRPRKIIALAAAACLVMFLGLSAAAYYIPATYVSIDVNPSIEYGVNMFDRVVSVRGVNDDGSEIVDEIDIGNLKNKKINEAITLTVNKIAEKGYLDNENAGIVISTSSNNMEEADELAQNLYDTVNAACEQNNCKAEICSEAVGKERVEKAKALGVTPGKLNLLEKLQSSSENPEDFDINEWLTKSVAEIMSQTKQNKEQGNNQNGNHQNQNGDNGTQEQNQEENNGQDTSNQEQNYNSESNGNGNGNVSNGNVSNNNSGNDNGNNNGNDNSKDNGKDNGKDKDNKNVMNGECDGERNGECSNECDGVCNGECSNECGNDNRNDKGNSDSTGKYNSKGTAETENNESEYDKYDSSKSVQAGEQSEKGESHNTGKGKN
ncbi:MAG: hypothetical protein PHW77_07480 [Eubacteriales bacterium]|nr:hypothetical protein [Eubacteriales bacterium]